MRIKPRPPKPDDSALEAPVVWVRDHTFWRDVAAQALSTGLVALVAYVYAVSGGYIATPTGRSLITAACVTVTLAALCVGGWQARRGNYKGGVIALGVGSIFFAMAFILTAIGVEDHWKPVLTALGVMAIAVSVVIGAPTWVWMVRRRIAVRRQRKREQAQATG